MFFNQYASSFAILILLPFTLQENIISILSTKGEISFTKVVNYTIDLSEIKEKIEYLLDKSIIAIQLVVISDIDQSKKAEPVKLYSKLNGIPQPQNSIYDKKDDNGVYDQVKKIFLYNIEYSSCEIKLSDVIHLMIVGIEGRSTFTLNIELINSNEFKIICPKIQGGDKSFWDYYGEYTMTSMGIAKFGGINILGNQVNNDLFILDESGEWKKIKFNQTSLPQPRAGMGFSSFDNGKYILLYGGEVAVKNYINDMWVLNVSELKWYNIYDNSTAVTHSPNNNNFPGTLLFKNYGKFIIFGGKYKTNRIIYSLDISTLKEILSLVRENTKVDPVKKSILLGDLFTSYVIDELTPRYGMGMAMINQNEFMIFGGIDTVNDYPVNDCDIINVETFIHVKKVDVSNGPSPRFFMGLKEMGSIVFLYGGKDSNKKDLKDLWKFNCITKQWIKIEDSSIDFNMNYFSKSYMFITSNYLNDNKNSERPLIISKDPSIKDILILNFPICESDNQIYSKQFCLPCGNGYEYTGGECEECFPGQYLSFSYSTSELYSKSKCTPCPLGTYNTFYSMQGKTSCLVCPFGTYNDRNGQKTCKKCSNKEICLIGSTKSLSSYDLREYISNDEIKKNNYIYVDNYPEFIDQNSKMKFLSITTGCFTVGVFTTIVILIISICFKCKKDKTLSFLAFMDFIPLTGGSGKKANGGLITIVYSILITSLAISFILRYFLWNDIVEITTIDDTTNSKGLGELKSSFEIDIDVYGENIPCQLEKSDKYSECHQAILFSKNNNYTFFIGEKSKKFSCKGDNNICHIKFQCENCKYFTNKDRLNINIRNKETYVSLYKYTFNNYWYENLPYGENQQLIEFSYIGYSKLKGIFKASDDILKESYVFKGNEKPSTILFVLSPIYYSIKSSNQLLSGYRLSLSSYERGDVRNEYSFENESDGVILNLEFIFNQSRNMVGVKKDISLLDFFAFILGMLAGFSFLSRVSKFIFEKCNWLNYKYNSFSELKEEINDNINNIEMGKRDNNQNEF